MSNSFSRFLGSAVYFFSNPIVLSSLSSWFVSQFIKGIIALFHIRTIGFKEVLEAFFWRTGGMPSSHAAVVTSMTAAVAFNEGLGSNLFAVSLLIAFVVMRDAMGVRRAVGIQSSALNILGRKLEEKLGDEFQPVKEIQGHAPLEVVAGAIIGIVISAIFAFL